MQNKFKLITDLLNDLVSQAYDNAANATCVRCARGLPVELVTVAQCPPLAEIGDYDDDDGPIYIHRRDDKELFANFLCDANGIHALKDRRL